MIMQQQQQQQEEAAQDLGCAASYNEDEDCAAAASPAQRMLPSTEYCKPNTLYTHITPVIHSPVYRHTHILRSPPTSLVPPKELTHTQLTHTHNVDDFTPLGTLGRGNMGTVILVLSKQCSSPSALFALKITHSLSTKKHERCHVERDILSSLHHPFLQTLHSHFESGLHSLLLLDFCSGGDLNLLRHRQPEKRFSETAARFYAAEVLVALEYLHKLGIVYRDLKPENILVQESGHIKLTDFDLSLKLGSGRRADSDAGTKTSVSSASRPPICSLKQQLATEAEADSVHQGKHSLQYCGAYAGLKKCITRISREGALKRNLGHRRVQGGGCLCGTIRDQGHGEGCLSRRKRGGLRRGRKYVAKDEARKLRNVTKRKPRIATIRAPLCFSCFKSKLEAEYIHAEEKSVCVVGTDEYVAPELLRGEEHGFSMDWWSFGIFLYEMIYGNTPFKGRSSEETLCNILEKKPEFPGMKTPAKNLIAQLLVKDPAARLGTTGTSDIKQHPFFHGLNWDTLSHICRPPFIPPPLCLSELEERYSAKLKTKRSETQNEEKLPNTCISWLDEVVESMEAVENEHQSSQYSRSSSSAGFMSSSVDGADRELRRDDDVDAFFFSSAEWSSELDVCVNPSS